MFTNQENTISNLNPGADDLWFLPLGGTGEIGMNLNLYGHQGKWLMVDCGVSFNEPLVPTTKAPDSALADTFAVVAPLLLKTKTLWLAWLLLMVMKITLAPYRICGSGFAARFIPPLLLLNY